MPLSSVHDWGPQGLWGMRNLQFLLWNLGNMSKFFKGTWGANWILGAVSNFFWGNSQKAFLGISEILEIFLGNTEIQTPWGPHDCMLCQDVVKIARSSTHIKLL